MGKYWVNEDLESLKTSCEDRRKASSFASFGEYDGYGMTPLANVRKLYQSYYGVSKGGSSSHINSAGENGSENTMHVNLTRYHLDYKHSLVTAQPVAFSVDPVTTDAADVDCAIVAKALLEYVRTEKDWESCAKEMALWAYLTTEGWLVATWDESAGDTYGISEEGDAEINAGDIKLEVFGPLDVTRDRYRGGSKDEWIIVHRVVNKYDLIAKYASNDEKLAEDIENSSLDKTEYNWLLTGSTRLYEDDSYVRVSTLWHERTPAVPNGKEFVYIQDGPVLFHGDIPYESIPAVMYRSSTILGTGYGYTNGFDLLGLQDAYNMLISNVVSNYAKFGATKYQVSSTSELDSSAVIGGSKLVYTNAEDKITTIPSPDHNPEMLQGAAYFQQLAQQTMGQNDASTGQIASSSRLSADVVSTLLQQSLQFMSRDQLGYARALTQSAKIVLSIFLRKSRLPRALKILGKNRSMILQHVILSDRLKRINNLDIKLDQVDAVPRPIRAAQAAQLLQYGMFEDKNIKEFDTYIMTGKIDRQIETSAEIINSLQREREMLLNGEVPEPLLVEDPVLHIRSLCAFVQSTPQVKQDPVLLQNTLDLIDKHTQNALSTSAELAFLYGHTPGIYQPSMGQQPVAQQGQQQGVNATPEATTQDGSEVSAELPIP